jgi:hypothetical protein
MTLIASRLRNSGLSVRGISLTDGLVLAAFLLLPIYVCWGLRDPFADAKWLGVLLVQSLLFIGMASAREVLIPRLNPLERTALGFILLSCCLQGIFRPISDVRTFLLERLGFCALSLLSFSFFTRHRDGLTWLAHVLSISSFLVVVIGMSPYFGLSASSTFGQANMTAQFLGIAVLFQLYAYAKQTSMKNRLQIGASIALNIAYILLLSCRSVLIALGIGFIISFWQRILNLRSIAAILFSAGIAAWTLSSWQLKPNDGYPALSVGLYSEKISNANYRVENWLETLRMIRDHPLGVGPRNFEGYFPFYRALPPNPGDERFIDLSPHNEYLRFIAEDGIGWSALYIAVLLLVSFRLLSDPERRHRNIEHTFVLLAVAYFAVEMMFQFPFENAFPYFTGACIIGFILSFGPAQIWRREGSRFFATLWPMLALTFFGVSSLKFYAFFNAESAEDGVRARACALWPGSWRNCASVIEDDIDSGRLDEAKEKIDAFLVSGPALFPLVRLQGEVFFGQGDIKSACFSFWRYDSLFGFKSSLHSFIEEECPAALIASFSLDTPGH